MIVAYSLSEKSTSVWVSVETEIHLSHETTHSVCCLLNASATIQTILASVLKHQPTTRNIAIIFKEENKRYTQAHREQYFNILKETRVSLMLFSICGSRHKIISMSLVVLRAIL